MPAMIKIEPPRSGLRETIAGESNAARCRNACNSVAARLNSVQTMR